MNGLIDVRLDECMNGFLSVCMGVIRWARSAEGLLGA